jgi:carboxymethylenebutenolidase
MTSKSTNDDDIGGRMDQGTQRYLVEEELEHYRDGWISRREFIHRASLLGVGAAIATTMAGTIAPKMFAAPLAQGTSPYSVPEGDPAVITERVHYASTDSVQVEAFVARPAAAVQSRSLPGVAVCHENQGLNPHTEDVARRFAKAGYVAIAPDLVSRVGPPTRELPDLSAIMGAYQRLEAPQNARDFLAALEWLESHGAVDGTKLAATGYCFGGGVIWRLTTIAPQLKAAAPFYGSNPPIADVPNIKAAVLGVYGDLDARINEGIPEIESALQLAGVTHRIMVYPDSEHAFHADFRPSYNQTTATQAWGDTLRWFAEHLGLPAPTLMS